MSDFYDHAGKHSTIHMLIYAHTHTHIGTHCIHQHIYALFARVRKKYPSVTLHALALSLYGVSSAQHICKLQKD